MSKKVLQLVGSFHQGGTERQAVQLARLLKQDGKVDLHLATMKKEGALLVDVESLGFDAIPEFRIGSFFGPGFPIGVNQAARFVRENHIDVIHSHDFYTNVFGAAVAAASGVSRFIASKRETGGMRTSAQRFIENLAFRRADGILANSEAVKKYLIGQGVDEGKLHVVNNGIDIEEKAPKLQDRRKICGLLGLPQEDDLLFVTVVANLRHEVKNIPMFIRAAMKIGAVRPQVHFVVAGEGDLRGELERISVEHGMHARIHFIGRCDNVPELLHLSDVCVLTSRHEGFPNAVLEYMAAGRPVVATDVGGAGELVQDGVNGYLVASDDSDALAKRIVELIEDENLRKSLGENGRTKAQTRFSTDSQLRGTLALYGV